MKPFRYHPFDLRQLVSFAEIARTGSFRQAAKTLLTARRTCKHSVNKTRTKVIEGITKKRTANPTTSEGSATMDVALSGSRRYVTLGSLWAVWLFDALDRL
jgi:hypothetical protein